MDSFWTLPNKITALRIILLGFFLFYLFSVNTFNLILSLIAAILIFILDWADGFFARISKNKTEFGADYAVCVCILASDFFHNPDDISLQRNYY